MRREDRLNVLEQTLKQRRLSQSEEDELYELLERFNRLDSWLDSNGVVIFSNEEEIIYDDKEFLKSICEPVVPLELDRSLTYHNKGKLYRKSTVQYLLKITSSAAAIAMFIWFIIQPTKEIDLKVSMPSTVTQKSNIETIEKVEVVGNIKTVEKVEVATKSARTIDVKIKTKPIKIGRLIAIKTSSTLESKTPFEEVSKHKVVESEIIEMQIAPSEIVLYADAAKWEDSEQVEEMIINHEEWTHSESRSKQRLKGFVSRFTNKYKQI